MKRYEFHSSLPPEQVFARLDAYARPGDMTAFGDGTFRFKRKKDRFYLGYAGTLPANGSVPFSGKVRAEEGGSVISGGFSVWAVWALLAAVSVSFCLMALAFSAPLIMAIVMSALWALLCGMAFTWSQTVFFKKRQQAVLEFIRQRLLK